MGQKPFNLYAKRSYGDNRNIHHWQTIEQPRGPWVDVMMPDGDGVMREQQPTGWNWYGIVWPVNPHNTGKRGILEILNRLIPAGRGVHEVALAQKGE